MKFTTNDVATATMELQQALPGAVIHWVGSSYIQGEGQDLDLVMLTPTGFGGPEVMSLGYSWTGVDSGEEDEFKTYRKGHVNLITTDDPDFLEQFKRSAEVCRFLYESYGLGDKTLRIAIHRLIMNGENCPTVKQRLGLRP